MNADDRITPTKPSYEVVITSFNRPKLTETCLQRLEQIRKTVSNLTVVLVDASTDSQTRQICNRFSSFVSYKSVPPETHWAAGMRIGEDFFLDKEFHKPSDYLVWLNDDVLPDLDAFQRVEETISKIDSNREFIAVCALRTSHGSSLYGGLRRSKWNPLGFRLVLPAPYAQVVDTFHGNFVFVPAESRRRLGRIDPLFKHHTADIEFGLRNQARGGTNLLLPGMFGKCDPNVDTPSGLRSAWAQYRSIKGGGFKEARERLLDAQGVRLPQLWGFTADVAHFLRLLKGFALLSGGRFPGKKASGRAAETNR